MRAAWTDLVMVTMHYPYFSLVDPGSICDRVLVFDERHVDTGVLESLGPNAYAGSWTNVVAICDYDAEWGDTFIKFD